MRKEKKGMRGQVQIHVQCNTYLSSGSVSGQCVSIQSILLTIVGGVTSLAKLKCTILTCSMKCEDGLICVHVSNLQQGIHTHVQVFVS